MLRSYQYVAYSSLFRRLAAINPPAEEAARLRRWADQWVFWISAAFLRSYRATAAGAPFLPSERADLETVLEVFILEKAIYEVAYEMNNRPDWLLIPLSGVLNLLGPLP
jgi:maltose alpha-D-glucosyltransferase/alpha-amylase